MLSEFRKLDIIETEGETADICFSVGPDDGKTKILRGNKMILQKRSEVFRALIRSQNFPDEPVRIRDFHPRIFQVILDYCHAGEMERKIHTMEDCIRFADAADKFKLKNLGLMANDKLIKEFLNEENVWKTLGENYLNKYVKSACFELLAKKAETLLTRTDELKNFDEGALCEFLQRDEMNIESELSLIKACARFAKGKENSRELFRSKFLPYLRLLTVKTQDLDEISDWLTPKEKMFLIHTQHKPVRILANHNILPCDSINQSEVPRMREPTTLILMASPEIVEVKEVVRRGEFIKTLKTEHKFSLSFVAKECLEIKGFEVFSPLDSELADQDLIDLNPVLSRASYIVPDDKDKFRAFVKIELRGNLLANKELESVYPLKLNEWILFEKTIMVPKNAVLTLEVTCGSASKNRRVFRKNIADDPRCILEKNSPSVQGHIGGIKLEQYGRKEDDEPFKLVCKKEEKFNIFKCLYYNLA